MDSEQFKQMVQFSKNNPDDAHSIEFEKRIKEGRYNDTLSSFGIDPVKAGAKPVPITEEQPEGPTAAGKLIRGVTKPVAEFGQSLFNIGQKVAGQEPTDLESNYWGHLERIGKKFDVTKGFTPDNLNALGEAAHHGLDIATLLPADLLAKAGWSEGVKVFGDLGGLVKAIGTKSPEEMKAYIMDKFTKAVRPSVGEKNTVSQAEAASNKAYQAVKTIVENKPNLKLVNEVGEQTGKLPETLHEFSQAIDQTKSKIYEEYNALATKAGGKGAEVDLVPLADELDKVGSDAVLMDTNPSIAKYATEKAETFRTRGVYSTEQTQQAIQSYNKSLEAFYKNPSYENASKASIDALIVNNMRKGLDDMIEKAVGSGYQDLKNQYGALRSIEKDVVNRTLVEARKNAKGLIDFTDVFTAGQALKGILMHDPNSFIIGGAQAGIKAFYRFMNDPNRAIRLMFEETEKLAGKEGVIDKFQPKSAIGKWMKNPEIGLSMKNIAPDLQKFQEGKIDTVEFQKKLKGMFPDVEQGLLDEIGNGAQAVREQGESVSDYVTNQLSDLLSKKNPKIEQNLWHGSKQSNLSPNELKFEDNSRGYLSLTPEHDYAESFTTSDYGTKGSLYKIRLKDNIKKISYDKLPEDIRKELNNLEKDYYEEVKAAEDYPGENKYPDSENYKFAAEQTLSRLARKYGIEAIEFPESIHFADEIIGDKGEVRIFSKNAISNMKKSK